MIHGSGSVRLLEIETHQLTVLPIICGIRGPIYLPVGSANIKVVDYTYSHQALVEHVGVQEDQ